MQRLEIKNDILYVSDDRHDYQITLNAIDIACYDGLVIDLKLFDGNQAFIHPNSQNNEDWNKLASLLKQYANFYQCDGYMVINLDNLQECSFDQTCDKWGYYNVVMKFNRMQSGISTKSLKKAKEIENSVNLVKQSYDSINSSEIR